VSFAKILLDCEVRVARKGKKWNT